MARCGHRPCPADAAKDRTRLPFEHDLRIRLNGSAAMSEARLVWSTPIIPARGYTMANVFASLTIWDDSIPGGGDWAIMGTIVQYQNTALTRGPMTGVGQGLVGVGKVFEGYQTYRLPIFRATLNPAAEQSLLGGIGFALYELGQPANRIIRCRVDGMIVCGRSY